jgi:multidrug efflux system membrane fusion protein
MPRISPIALAAVCLLGAAAWIASGQLAPKPEGGNAERAATVDAASALRSVRVVRSSAETREEIVRVLGHTAAVRKVELKAEISGRVVELPVERGARVAPGEIIVRLSTDDREARLAEAQALLKQRMLEHTAAAQLAQRGFRAETSLAEAAAKLDAARAAVTRMEIELGHTTIAAPFAGTLDARPIELGSFVKDGDPVGTIVDLDPLRVVGWVAERDIARIAEGAPGQAALPDGRVLEGRVVYVGRVADTNTRTFKIELELPNPEARVPEGLTAEIRLPIGRALAHRMTPSLLTLADDGAVGVKTVEDGVVRFRRVTLLGEEDGAFWVGGLPHELVLVSVGQEFVRDGQRVEAVFAVAERG